MSRKVSKQKKAFQKTDVRYWEGKVAFHTAASRTYSRADSARQPASADQSQDAE